MLRPRVSVCLGLVFYCGVEASVQPLGLFQFVISVPVLYGFEFQSCHRGMVPLV